MTHTRLSAILTLLRWSARDLAAAVAMNERTVRRWLSGDYPIPADVADWLETLAAAHAANPAPKKG